MSSVKIKGNDNGTGILYLNAPNTNTDRTINLPDESGTVLLNGSTITPFGVPCFSATKTSNQSLTSGTTATLTCGTESFDTNGWYDTTTYRFTPQIAGYYYISLALATDGTSQTLGRITLLKNGTTTYYCDSFFLSTGTNNTMYMGGGALIQFNGSTDYIEGKVRVNATSPVVTADTINFSGFLVSAI